MYQATIWYSAECSVAPLKSENYLDVFKLCSSLVDWWYKNYQPEECTRATNIFGRRISDDRLSRTKFISEPKEDCSFTYLEYEFEPRISLNHCNITSVEIENLYTKCDCLEEAIRITGGGIGKNSIKIEIISGMHCPIERKFMVFTKC